MNQSTADVQEIPSAMVKKRRKKTKKTMKDIEKSFKKRRRSRGAARALVLMSELNPYIDNKATPGTCMHNTPY